MSILRGCLKRISLQDANYWIYSPTGSNLAEPDRERNRQLSRLLSRIHDLITDPRATLKNYLDMHFTNIYPMLLRTKYHARPYLQFSTSGFA